MRRRGGAWSGAKRSAAGSREALGAYVRCWRAEDVTDLPERKQESRRARAAARAGAAPPALTPPRAAAPMRPMKYRDLAPEEAQAELQRDPTLRVLDVRTVQEHASHRLPGATLIPVQELDRRLGELDPATNWLVHCEHGRRSLFACEVLAQAGFGKLANLRGGLAHWSGCGLPLETGKPR